MKNPLIIILLVLSSCVEPIDLNTESNISESVVIEGGITTEVKFHSVKLTKTHAATGRNPAQPASGATVSIYSDNINIPLVETEPGIYSTTEEVAAKIGHVYTLEINLDNQVYRASDSVVAAVPQTGIEYHPLVAVPPGFDNSAAYFEFIYRDNFGAPEPFRYTIITELDPDVLSYYPSEWQPPRWLQDRLDNQEYLTVDSSYYLHPAIELPGILSYGETNETRLLYGSRITERFLSVSDKHYEFIRAFMSETEWKTLGPFSYVEGDVNGNVSNGGKGFFYAADVYTIVQVIPTN